jgi:hypothetical protein
VVRRAWYAGGAAEVARWTMDGDLVADALGFWCTDAGFAAPAAPAAETVDVYLDAFLTEGPSGTMTQRPGRVAMTLRIALLSASRTWELVLSLSGSSSESFGVHLRFGCTLRCATPFLSSTSRVCLCAVCMLVSSILVPSFCIPLSIPKYKLPTAIIVRLNTSTTLSPARIAFGVSVNSA